MLAARVVFWDAEGQFLLEAHVDEVLLTIVEELTANKAVKQDLDLPRVERATQTHWPKRN